MSLQKLEPLEWSSFCNQLSRRLSGKRAQIEIASLHFGVQLEASWQPVVGMVYDADADVIEILMDGADHLVLHPREVYVECGLLGVESVGIVDRDRSWQIVVLRDPLLLPSPRAQADSVHA